MFNLNINGTTVGLVQMTKLSSNVSSFTFENDIRYHIILKSSSPTTNVVAQPYITFNSTNYYGEFDFINCSATWTKVSTGSIQTNNKYGTCYQYIINNNYEKLDNRVSELSNYKPVVTPISVTISVNSGLMDVYKYI